MLKPIKLTKRELDTLITRLIKELEFLEEIRLETEDELTEEDEMDRENLISIIKKLKETGVEWKRIGYGMFSTMINEQQVVRMTMNKTKKPKISLKSLGVLCPYCNSIEIVRNGIRINKKQGRKQRYLCESCKRRFC